MPTVAKKLYVDETEEELLRMSRYEVTMGLNEKQIAFCEYYTSNYNIRLAAIRAGYAPKSAHVIGFKLRQDPEVNRYLAWLKIRISNECHISAMDIIDHYARIAFGDITETLKEKRLPNGKVVGLDLEDLDKIDGQLIKKITKNQKGITVELHDKLKALQRLEMYFDVMPKTWQQEIAEKKLEIDKERLEIEKIKIGITSELEEDDGFIEALKSEANNQELWDTEVEFEE